MASLYPAKAIKIDDSYGKITEGYKANIVLLNDNNQVEHIFQMGRQEF